MQMSEEEIRAFLRDNCCPVGHKWTLVLISLTKRLLKEEMPASYRLEFLEHLDRMTADENRTWLTSEMVAAIEPVCDRGYEIMREAHKLGAKKELDVYADVFVTFARLNPSLIAALESSPTYHSVADYKARTLGHHVT